MSNWGGFQYQKYRVPIPGGFGYGSPEYRPSRRSHVFLTRSGISRAWPTRGDQYHRWWVSLSCGGGTNGSVLGPVAATTVKYWFQYIAVPRPAGMTPMTALISSALNHRLDERSGAARSA